MECRQEGSVHAFGVVLILVVGALLLGNLPSCGSGGRTRSFSHGRDAGRLAAENARLQEYQRKATERLAVERRRSAQLVTEVRTHQNVQALLVGTTVLGGCALAMTIYALVRRRRRAAS